LVLCFDSLCAVVDVFLHHLVLSKKNIKILPLLPLIGRAQKSRVPLFKLASATPLHIFAPIFALLTDGTGTPTNGQQMAAVANGQPQPNQAKPFPNPNSKLPPIHPSTKGHNNKCDRNGTVF
jgi:hypothetical protein